MNGLHTRHQLARAAGRPQHNGDTRPIDRFIALACAIGLIVILAEQLFRQMFSQVGV
jgi:hypothetical protein